MQKTVVITDHGFSDIDHEKAVLEGAGYRLVEAKCTTEDEVIAVAGNADALLVQWAPVTRKVIEKLTRCQVIVRYGIGVDNIDLNAARDHGIPVANVPDYCIEEVATHTLALALALQRRLLSTDGRLRENTWKIIPPGPVKPASETMFTVLGLGRIAVSVIRKAKALGFVVAASDPYVDQATMEQLQVKKLSFEEALAHSDILSLHLPLTDETRHCIRRETIAQMKASAILVNTSRGGLINTNELAAALIAGEVGGAGLDVFEKEPLETDHPLRSAPNTILTSHTAWYSERSIPLLQKLAAEEVARILGGAPLKNRIA